MTGSVMTGSVMTVVALGVACGSDDGGGDEAGTGQAAAPESVGDDGGGDCSPGSIPGCAMVVEVCEGGQCGCQCADAATTGDDDTGTGSADTGAAMCPDEATDSDVPPVCDAPATACDTIGGCCRCDTFDGCGDDPVWMCVELVPDPSCPTDAPDVGDPCDAEGTVCRLCDTDGPVVRTCNAGAWTEGFFSCV
jgi:hypothetical protein